MLGFKETHIFHIIDPLWLCYCRSQTRQVFIPILVGWICLATISQCEKERWYHGWCQRRRVLQSINPAFFPSLSFRWCECNRMSPPRCFSSPPNAVLGCQDGDATMQRSREVEHRKNNTHTPWHAHKRALRGTRRHSWKYINCLNLLSVRFVEHLPMSSASGKKDTLATAKHSRR